MSGPVDAWLLQVRDELPNPRAHRQQLDELAESLREAADEMGAEQACAAFGDPAAVARQLAAEHPEAAAPLVGSPLGLNPATIHRRLADMFNPADSRLLVPAVAGIGWTVNLGALAVRLHLEEPDVLDHDVMDALDEPPLRTAAVAVTLVALGTVALLPFGLGQERLPNHWPLVGPPDGWVRPLTGQWMQLVIAVTAVALAWLPGRLGASQLWRVLLLVTGMMLATTGTGVTALQVFGHDAPVGWLIFPLMLTAAAAAMAVGVGLLRAGARRAARRHSNTTARSPR